MRFSNQNPFCLTIFFIKLLFFFLKMRSLLITILTIIACVQCEVTLSFFSLNDIHGYVINRLYFFFFILLLFDSWIIFNLFIRPDCKIVLDI